MNRTLLFTSCILLFTAIGIVAHAQSGAANSARESMLTNAESQARGELESLLARLCPGRCELVDLRAVVSDPRPRGDVLPGFEGPGGNQFDVQVRRIEATILMDSSLPENFRTNIPRMAQFRLQYLAPTIDIRPEFLEFPQPQLPPMPDPLPSIPNEPPPRPQAQPLPEPPPVPEAPATNPDPTPEVDPPAAQPLWVEFLPSISLLLTLLILGALILIILRRLEAIALATTNDPTLPPVNQPDDPIFMPDPEALRSELKQSRSALNRMLRRWIDDSPEEVALLVRFIGPSILADLQQDPDSRQALLGVSTHVAQHHAPPDAPTAREITDKALARHAAEMVVENTSADTEWHFLEGLSLPQITRLMKDTSPRERTFLLARLTPVFRSRYLESLDTTARRTLLLDASDAESLTKSQARELAARLRTLADEFADAGRQAHGQASMIVEMINSLGLSEQASLLRDLVDAKPDVAQATLSHILLESSLSRLPDGPLSNAIHRLSLQTLTTFLQGTNPAFKSHILRHAPPSKRRALETELSLDIPSTRADFLEARQVLMSSLLATLHRDGIDVASLNLATLRANDPASTSTEAS